MSESTRRKSVPATTARRLPKRIPIKVRYAALGTVLMLANLPDVAFAEAPCRGIHVKVLDIKNSAGTVACALFDAPEGFPKEFLRYATNIMMMKIQDMQGRCDFLDIPPGKYALAVIHDEDMDGELATNALGIPMEGYGFSSDANAFLSAPSFADARFPYEGGALDLTISLNYQPEPGEQPQY